jgi:hypothetical protein
MSNQFENLRDKLREAGCQMQCAEQVKTANGAFIELWLVYRPSMGIPTRIMVIDERDCGYHLFIENQTNKIDDDVAAIICDHATGRLEKVA